MGGFTPPYLLPTPTTNPTSTPTYLPYSTVSLIHAPLFLLLPAGITTCHNAHGVCPQLMHIKLRQLCCARVLLALCGSVSASNNIGHMLHMCDV